VKHHARMLSMSSVLRTMEKRSYYEEPAHGHCANHAQNAMSHDIFLSPEIFFQVLFCVIMALP